MASQRSALVLRTRVGVDAGDSTQAGCLGWNERAWGLVGTSALIRAVRLLGTERLSGTDRCGRWLMLLGAAWLR